MKEVDKMVFSEFISQHLNKSAEFLKGAETCFEWLILRGEWEEDMKQ